MLKCNGSIAPNFHFMGQLSEFEQSLGLARPVRSLIFDLSRSTVILTLYENCPYRVSRFLMTPLYYSLSLDCVSLISGALILFRSADVRPASSSLRPRLVGPAPSVSLVRRRGGNRVLCELRPPPGVLFRRGRDARVTFLQETSHEA